MIELNRLSILFDRKAFIAEPKSFILLESEIPVIHTPFKLGLVDLSWKMEEYNELPAQWHCVMNGELVGPGWAIRSMMEVRMELEFIHDIGRWGEKIPFRLVSMYLDDKSRFYIDDHEVDLTDTINGILIQPGTVSNMLDRINWDNHLIQLSKKHFGSDIIRDLISNLYYQVEGDFQEDKMKITLSAAQDLEHFSEIDEAPPYAFIKIPTDELVYFVNHFTWPSIEIKGYQLALVSIEVKYDNILIINIKELDKDWDISLDISISLRGNVLYPEVTNIKAGGLNYLKKALFKIFKGLLIREIEKNTIPVSEIYLKVKSELEMKYPFLQIQPDWLPVLDVLSVNVEKTEMMVHFEEYELKE